MTLNWAHYTPVSLVAALDKVLQIAEGAAGPSLAALIYTPESCRWCDAAYLRDKETSADMGKAFEARLFCPLLEARWRRRGAGGEGELAFLSDNLALDGPLSDDVLEEPLERRYLLWGTADNTGEELLSSRIGALKVPSALREGLERGNRLVLVAKEFLARDSHGSAYVYEQLLSHVEREQGHG